MASTDIISLSSSGNQSLIRPAGSDNRGVVIRRRDSITQWYTPLNSADNQASVAQDAYQKALLFCKQQLKPDEQQVWLDQTSEKDVLKIAQDAKAKYEGTSKGKGRAGEIFKHFSSQVVHYSSILDVLVQHHPEYVSLAWGAIKFLFVATINYEELITKIASALSEIGAGLSRVELWAKLYPVKQMSLAIESLYAEIVQFCLRASRWYKGTKFHRVVRAISHPFPLEFKDIISRIDTQFRTIESLAIAASHAELRDLHITVQQMGQNSIQVGFGNAATSLRPNPSTSEPLQLKLDDIFPFLQSGAPSPAESLRIGNLMRERRRGRGNSSHSLWTSKELQKWAFEPVSSFLQVKSSVITADDSRDFALDMIKLAQSTKLPVVWCMDTDPNTSSFSAIDILKSLIQQILDDSPNAFTGLTAKLRQDHFQTCNTIEDWVKAFVAALSTISHILVVLVSNKKIESAIQDLKASWQEVTKLASTIVKVVIVADVSTASLIPLQQNTLTLSLDAGRRPGTGRGASRASKTINRNRFTSNNGADHLKPFFLKLLTTKQTSIAPS